jgi:hypothetical protein
MTASGTFTLSSNLTSVLNIIFPLELLDLMLSYAVDSDIQIAEVFLDAKKEKEQCKVSFCSEKTWCKWCNVVHPKSSCPKVLTRCLECKTVFPTDDTISDAWHNEYCVKIAECEKCDRKDTRWNLRSRKHNDTCPKTLILCVQCLKLFERATMYSHLSNDCPETDVKPQCKCQAFLASVKRKDLQKEHDCFDVLLEELRRVKRQEYRNPFPLYGFAK